MYMHYLDGKDKSVEIVRAMIAHEDGLVNHQITWALTMQGFLITASVVLWNSDKSDLNKLAILLIAVLAICLLISFWITLRLNHKAIETLREPFKDCFPPVIGHFGKDRTVFGKVSLIWNFIPFSILMFWVVIIIYMLYSLGLIG